MNGSEVMLEDLGVAIQNHDAVHAAVVHSKFDDHVLSSCASATVHEAGRGLVPRLAVVSVHARCGL